MGERLIGLEQQSMYTQQTALSDKGMYVHQLRGFQTIHPNLNDLDQYPFKAIGHRRVLEESNNGAETYDALAILF